MKEEIIKMEAVRRGYKNGVTVNQRELHNSLPCEYELKGDDIVYDSNLDIMYMGGFSIYSKGKWAKIVG